MIYFSSTPVVPGSIDLKEFGLLNKFMDDCLKQGIVEKYDSILDFREKLSRKMDHKILSIRKMSEDETSRDPNEAAKKKLNDIISQKFCDLIEKYILYWTKEKNSKPINFDDGKRILKDLKKETLSLSASIAQIFDKDMIRNIAEIMSKIDKLQKYRLYFDSKSIREFWKVGDEILSSLDSIAGKVRENIHGHADSKN
jgi:ferredoxin-fold anticodon binding domain-containing protein